MHRFQLPHLVLLLVGSILLTVSLGFGATINSTTVSGNQLTIHGTGFTGALAVTLGGQKLTIISSTTTQIVAQMSSVPTAGSFRLVVKAGTTSCFAYIQVPLPPAIVAQAALTNVTVPIPVTTLMTVTQSGLYRVSINETGLSGCNAIAPSDLNLRWTDDGGPRLAYVGLPALTNGVTGGMVLNLRFNPGSIVSYESADLLCTPFELYITVEQIQ